VIQITLLAFLAWMVITLVQEIAINAALFVLLVQIIASAALAKADIIFLEVIALPVTLFALLAQAIIKVAIHVYQQVII
jgi:hypothetical protein